MLVLAVFRSFDVDVALNQCTTVHSKRPTSMETHTTLSDAKPFIDPNWIDFLLGHLDPVLSVSRTRARITAIVDETDDIRTFVLRPNRHFRGFAPGQYVPVRVTLGGVVHERCYSLTGT